jgi:hypothetical protein
VSGGIKAGVNFSSQTYSGSGFSLSPDGLVGFNGGVYLTAMFTENVGIQPEILYSLQGVQNTSNGTTFKDKFGYINVPILFRYNVIPAFNIHAGPQVGFLLSADETQGSNTASFKDQVKGTDFGLAFGAGFDLPAGFNGGLRYSLGLSDINGVSGSSTSIKNNNLQIYLGWRLFGGK